MTPNNSVDTNTVDPMAALLSAISQLTLAVGALQAQSALGNNHNTSASTSAANASAAAASVNTAAPVAGLSQGAPIAGSSQGAAAAIVGEIAADQRWYLVTRGRAIGAIQGWHNVLPLVLSVRGACYTRQAGRKEAEAAFAAALLVPGLVREI